MAQLDANLLNRIASPVTDYQNMVAARMSNQLREQQMAENQFNMENSQKKAKREIQEADLGLIGKAVANADTPEKYAQAMDYLASQGFDVDDDDRNFNNRQAILDAAGTASGGKDFTLVPGASRYDANGNLIATAPGKSTAETKPPAGYRYNEAGDLEFIKGGPADPTKPAPARSLRPTTDQNNAAGFYDRMVDAEAVLSKPEVVAAAVDYAGKAKANVPLGIGNYLATPEYQKFDQAQRNFINAVLRKESGAAISASEFDNAAVQYFPQPGDTPEKIAQKAQNRATAINAMKRTAAGALQQGAQPQAPAEQPYPGADGITPEDQGGVFENGTATDFPPEAIEILAADPSPEARAEFDEVFGPGASARVLGE